MLRMSFYVPGLKPITVGGGPPFRALKYALVHLPVKNPKREPRGFCARNAERTASRIESAP